MIGGLFIDGPNLAASLSRKGSIGAPRRLDFAAFPKVLSRMLNPNGPVIDWRFKCYYGGFRHERDQMRRKEFIAMLNRLEWSVFETKAKECRRWRECSTCHQKVEPGSVFYQDKQTDLAVALDAYKLALLDQVKVLAVVTHDGDFAALFKRLPKTVRSVIVGWNGDIAQEILEVAEPVYMDEILSDVAYRP